MEKVYTSVMHVTLFVDRGVVCWIRRLKELEECSDGEEFAGLAFRPGIESCVRFILAPV
jgi:hypothetical protein